MKTILRYPQHKTVGNALMLTGLTIVLGLAGCQKEGADTADKKVERTSQSIGPATSAGQAIDRTAERAGSKMQNAQESAAEKTQSAGDYIDDAAITAQVKVALLDEPTLGTSRIEVTTSQGVVKLTGTVDSEQGISRAREVASAQKGVKSVEIDLSVTPIAPVK